MQVWWIATFPAIFGVNLLDGLREIEFYNDDGRQTPAPRHLALLTQLSEANNTRIYTFHEAKSSFHTFQVQYCMAQNCSTQSSRSKHG